MFRGYLTVNGDHVELKTNKMPTHRPFNKNKNVSGKSISKMQIESVIQTFCICFYIQTDQFVFLLGIGSFYFCQITPITRTKHATVIVENSVDATFIN